MMANQTKTTTSVIFIGVDEDVHPHLLREDYNAGRLTLTQGGDTRHETAEDWYDNLGYCADPGGLEADGVACCHPICPLDEVPAFNARLGTCEEDLIEYARDARDAALSLDASFEDAVKSYRRGDLGGVVDALEDAYNVECQYGDEPATRELANALLRRAEDDEA